MYKLQIISDKNKKSINIRNQLIKKLDSHQLYQPNLVIVIGGDGFMLETLKKNKKSSNLFYGINSGNYGFLMNKFSEKNIIKNLSKAKMIKISPLEMKVKSKNRTKKSLAINEVSILRQSRQAASISIKNVIKQRALVVKLVDTKDLKSLPVWECQFESGRGHH